MSEQLLKAIIQLFAIVAKERVTEDERTNIQDFLSLHLNRDAIGYYLDLFDEFSKESIEESSVENTDKETLAFINEWSKIIAISKRINEGLSQQQKAVLLVKMIELLWADKEMSERQGNLIFYIGKAIKFEKKHVDAIKAFVMSQDIEDLSMKEILIIDEGSGDHPYESLHLVRRNLTGFIAILRLPGIETYFIKYIGITPMVLNGVALKSRKIAILPTGSTIRGDKIDTVYFSDIIGKFLYSEVESKTSFKSKDLTYRFKNGDIGLRDINIAEDGGKLIGIMGASGSGKSTLLNVLNGNDRPSSGSVTINGIDIHQDPDKIEGVIGYVPQDDFLIEELTVFQNLYFAARLTFSNLNQSEIADLVQQILRSLGLTDTKDRKVGSPLEKVISGGQRKRLNIGLELLREPTLLYVDEPTSGLSSRDSENIMDLLKELSLRGKMVFVVIHQPSSDIYKMFDTLLILDVGGYPIYYGNPVEAVVYFKEIVNMADRDQGACIECGTVRVEQIFNIIETKIVNEFGRFTDQRKITSKEWNEYFKKYIKLPTITAFTDPLTVTQRIPNFFKQLLIFAQRDTLTKLSNKQYMLINMLEAPILALFLAYIARYHAQVGLADMPYTFFGNVNIPVYFFMSIIIALFMGLMVSAEELLRDRKILKREKFLNLSKGSYLLSKVLILFAISGVQTVLFILIGDFILEIEGMRLSYWLVLFSCSCFTNLLGLNISSAFNSAVTIYILIPLILIPQLVLSGVVISFDRFNPQISTPDEVPVIGEVMASRWGFEALMVTQYKDNRFERQFYELDKRVANSSYKSIYYIPVLEGKLSASLSNFQKTDSVSVAHFTYDLGVLRNEISKELDLVGRNQLTLFDRITPAQFDSAVWLETAQFLKTLKTYYLNRFNQADDQRQELIRRMTDTPRNLDIYNSTRKRYTNERVEVHVTNDGRKDRILEESGRLIRKIDPIFLDPIPTSSLDFRTQFFTPKKHFAGYYFETLLFNVLVIWSMTLLLGLTLYFDVLGKTVRLFSRDYQIRKATKA